MDAPATPPRRRRRKEARPGEILQAALDLFAERGFAATKLEDVAARAGIGKGTIYLYFPTKEDLFRAVVRERILPNFAMGEAVIEAYQGPCADLLRTMGRMFLLALETDLTAIPKLVLTESGNFPAIASFYAEEVVARGMKQLGVVLARGAASGEFRSMAPEVMLPLFVSPMLFLALWKHSLGRHSTIHFNAEAVIEAHLDMVLRGLAPVAP